MVTIFITNAVDRHRFDANPDTALDFDADPDPTQSCRSNRIRIHDTAHRFVKMYKLFFKSVWKELIFCLKSSVTSVFCAGRMLS